MIKLEKRKTREVLNLIVQADRYTPTSTQKFTQKYLCVVQELILRLFDYNSKDNKRWFFSPAETIINDIERIEFTKKII